MRRQLNSFNTTLVAAALSLMLGACGDTGTPGTQTSTPNASLQNTLGTNNPINNVPGDPEIPTSDGPETSVGSNPGNPVSDTPAGSTIIPGSEFNSAAAGVQMRLPNSITATTDASGTMQFKNEQNTLGGFVFGGSAGGGQAGMAEA